MSATEPEWDDHGYLRPRRHQPLIHWRDDDRPEPTDDDERRDQ